MKLNKMSIKYKLFLYMTVLVALMLIMLWMFQIVFLDDFYKQIKTNDIKASAENISDNIDNEELDTLLDSLSQQRETSIKIFNEDGSEVYSSDLYSDSTEHGMRYDDFYKLYQKALDNGGTYFEISNREIFKGGPGGENPFVGNIKEPRRDFAQSMIYVNIVEKADGSKAVAILNSMITPVDATVDTLRVQLIYVTGITLLLALGFALLISKRISKPIIKINKSAKELAKGNYDTTFNGQGYLEISELNDTLNYAAKELSMVEELRRELIANISHDLRTPLTMITGYGEVMRDIPGENTPENVQIIIDESKRLTTLVNDILDISKLQSGTQKMAFERFNLTQSIREIMLRYTKLTEQDGYRLKFISNEDAWVNADTVKMSQVIYNLINNAITYTGEDKSVTIIQSISNDRVKIEIVDTGEGIAQDMLPLIWDRYYKVDKAHKRAAIGTGLGLSIVKTILDLHEGSRYGVLSTIGQGSIFWFELMTA
ncbi:signal transduction histidine kinase [Ruminiclostridium sufflavum DSM 19573]|uniref:histidine kinase n=1 Tax=Ruminiclostridium sufflavum DSM 19573 TaxID=1121337 RepID=A0A318XSJ3_9FIRM|nr:HAMP domain-containing sensor histidine kinase [Ruminiclostridium sufflavum]PYG89554.1 signal transduction histidine kinase [Ruminiclostridium sufflavum DSM 19573]